jgi:hypothetical protein
MRLLANPALVRAGHSTWRAPPHEVRSSWHAARSRDVVRRLLAKSRLGTLAHSAIMRFQTIVKRRLSFESRGPIRSVSNGNCFVIVPRTASPTPGVRVIPDAKGLTRHGPQSGHVAGSVQRANIFSGPLLATHRPIRRKAKRQGKY